MGLIDTHCHLDAAEFDADLESVIQEALYNDIKMIVVPAVHRSNFGTVTHLAQTHSCCAHALGIHPMYVATSQPEDLAFLAQEIASQMQSEHPPVAIGEIGLDFFIADFDKALQEHYFVEQLKIAKQYDLPVILHVRRAIDDILKHLRQYKVHGGIAHAFNGSRQQAEAFIDLGFKLGFGGAFTYPRALKIRELVSTLPLSAIVLETDAPDIPPEWLKNDRRNTPNQLLKISQLIASLRHINHSQVTEITTNNALEILPNLAKLFTRPKVIH
jgi:TatD DNase family protein